MSIKAIEMALEALEVRCGTNADERKPGGVIEALRTAIQQAEAKADETVALDDAGDTKSKAWAWDGVCVALNKHWPQWSARPTNGAACATLAIADMAKAASTHPAPGVPEFSRIAKRKLDELQEQGFSITGYAIQRGSVRGFIDGCGFVGWWQGEPDPGVPDGWRIEEKGGELIVQKNGFGGYSARKNTESIAEAVLHELALDLLAASPAQKGGE